MNKDTKGNYFILVLLILIGAVLRLYHPMDIPFSADELDALGRTKFNTFSELISKGVMIDAHPAGVEVFLYYWTKIFGYSELAVKLPFITFGILSILYIYILGKEWFNSTVGLVCATFIATLQYTIMYSQVARPNIPGLFFTLAMVYYWSKALFKPETNFKRNIILYILFSALCSYNHYYSLLIAGIVGVSGLFFIKRKYLSWYIASGISIFILYIPHIHIFLYQLHVGGLKGIIGAPRKSFIIDYFRYVFHFSKYLYFTVIALFLLGVFHTRRKGNPYYSKFMVISFCWFSIQFLIAFLYSLFISPVLEYSSLIFTFPFLLFCLFGWLPELSFPKKIILTSLVCIINITTLIAERNYYHIFYTSRYEQEVVLTDSAVNKYGANNVISFLSMKDDDSIPEYYNKKHHLNVPFIDVNDQTDKVWIMQYLDSHKSASYLTYGQISRNSPIYMSMFVDQYPYLVQQTNFDEGSFFVLTKNEGEGKSPYIFQSVNDFEKPCKYWSDANKANLCDTISHSGKYSYRMDSLSEWAPGFNCNVNDMIKNRNNLIMISLSLYPLGTMKDVQIVSEVVSGNKSLFWSATHVNEFFPETTVKKWVKAYHSIKLPDIDLNNPNVIVKVYIWNQGKRNFYMDDFEVKTIEANPLIYWMIDKP